GVGWTATLWGGTVPGMCCTVSEELVTRTGRSAPLRRHPLIHGLLSSLGVFWSSSCRASAGTIGGVLAVSALTGSRASTVTHRFKNAVSSLFFWANSSTDSFLS